MIWWKWNGKCYIWTKLKWTNFWFLWHSRTWPPFQKMTSSCIICKQALKKLAYTREIETLQNPCWQTIWRIFTNLRWLWHVYSSQYWYQSWGALGTSNTAVTAAIEFNCTNVNTPVTSASRPEHSNYSSLPRVSQYFNYARAHDQSRYLHTLSVPSRDRDSQYCH